MIGKFTNTSSCGVIPKQQAESCIFDQSHKQSPDHHVELSIKSKCVVFTFVVYD